MTHLFRVQEEPFEFDYELEKAHENDPELDGKSIPVEWCTWGKK